MHKQGYISGETLVDHNDPSKTLVVGTWQSIDDWERWKTDPQREEREEELLELMESPTQCEVYVYSKYRLGITGETELEDRKL